MVFDEIVLKVSTEQAGLQQVFLSKKRPLILGAELMEEWHHSKNYKSS